MRRSNVANGTDYALTGGFFSRSPANIERIKAQLEAGNVYINRPVHRVQSSAVIPSADSR